MTLLSAPINIGLNAIVGTVTHVSLHTANPGSSGTSEVSGGSYARQVPSFGSASGAAVGLTAAVSFSVPGSITVTHIGLWNGSTFLGSDDLSVPRTFSSPGTFTLDTLQIQGTSS